jgi:hypothetical protein
MTPTLLASAVLNAPGAVITTSTKADTYHLTQAARAKRGDVFLFDPHGLVAGRAAGESADGAPRQSWWCDLLGAITGLDDALRLVGHFFGPGIGVHGYFSFGAQRLAGELALAAAYGGGSLREVRAWLTTRSDEPVELLRQVGVHAVADRLSDTLNAPVDQRDALYETAGSAMRGLESEAITRFVSPPHTWAQPPRDPVVELDLQQLVANYLTDPARQPSPRRHRLPADPRPPAFGRSGDRRPGRPRVAAGGTGHGYANCADRTGGVPAARRPGAHMSPSRAAGSAVQAVG